MLSCSHLWPHGLPAAAGVGGRDALQLSSTTTCAIELGCHRKRDRPNAVQFELTALRQTAEKAREPMGFVSLPRTAALLAPRISKAYRFEKQLSSPPVGMSELLADKCNCTPSFVTCTESAWTFSALSLRSLIASSSSCCALSLGSENPTS